MEEPNEVNEFQVQLMSENVATRLRIIMINKEPVIQILEPKKNQFTDFYIREASKVFLSYKKKLVAKVIYHENEKKSIAFSCKDEQTFWSCVQKINSTLESYQQKQECLHISDDPRNSGPKSSEGDYTFITMISDETLDVQENPDLTSIYQYKFPVPEYLPTRNPIIHYETKLCLAPELNREDVSAPTFQILQLHQEMQHNGGVQINVSSDEVEKRIRVEDIDGKLTVVEIREAKLTNSQFLIGDVICKINDSVVTKMFEFNQFLRMPQLSLVLQRIPKGRACVLHGTTDIKNKKHHKIRINRKWCILTQVGMYNALHKDSNVAISEIFEKSHPCSVVWHERDFINCIEGSPKKKLFKSFK